MTNNFTYKRLNSSNYKDLVYLLKKVNKKSNSISYYQNKFNTNYTGVSNIGFFAYAENGEPAAFYGVFPMIFSNGDTDILACQSGDTVTNPKYQRKGLFIELARKTYDLAAKEGIVFVFGFPNNNSAHGFFHKLNWKKTEGFRQVVRNIKTNNLYNILNKFNILSPVYKLYFFFIAKIYFSEIIKINENSNKYYFTKRSKAYYSYKRQLKTSFILKINDFKIWITFGDGLIIGDIEQFDINSKATFEKSLRKLAKILGTNKVTIYYQANSFISLLYNEDNYFENELYSGHLHLDKSKSINMKYSFSDIDTF